MDELNLAKKGNILMNQLTKVPYLVLSNEQITINRVKLWNPKTAETTVYEAEVDMPIKLDKNMQMIGKDFLLHCSATRFEKVDTDVCEFYLLTEPHFNILKNKIAYLKNPDSQLDIMH